jgi:hypothetical protein
MRSYLTDNALADLGKHIHHATWHWTAGSWTATFDHYHFCITYDEKTGKAKVVQTRSILTPGAHVYKRNTGNIGISMCGMGRIRGKLHGIQAAQVEATAKLTAELCSVLGLDLDLVHDHAHFATIDGYGPGSGHRETRIDVGSFEPVLRKKAAWYLDQLAAGKQKREYTLALY